MAARSRSGTQWRNGVNIMERWRAKRGSARGGRGWATCDRLVEPDCHDAESWCSPCAMLVRRRAARAMLLRPLITSAATGSVHTVVGAA